MLHTDLKTTAETLIYNYVYNVANTSGNSGYLQLNKSKSVVPLDLDLQLEVSVVSERRVKWN